MFYILKKHLYLTQFRDEVIILDLKRDKYIILFPEESAILLKLLNNKYMLKDNCNILSKSKEISSKIRNTIQIFIDDKIVEKSYTPYPFRIDLKPNSIGVSNIDWRLPLKTRNLIVKKELINAFIMMVKVKYYMNIKGFYSTINLIKKSRGANIRYVIPSTKKREDLGHIINEACFIFPTRIKCLEWSITYVLLALKKRWKCNLEIGVQNYPFMSHAWVECDNKTVMDDQNLREELAIVLSEPFRK